MTLMSTDVRRAVQSLGDRLEDHHESRVPGNLARDSRECWTL